MFLFFFSVGLLWCAPTVMWNPNCWSPIPDFFLLFSVLWLWIFDRHPRYEQMTHAHKASSHHSSWMLLNAWLSFDPCPIWDVMHLFCCCCRFNRISWISCMLSNHLIFHHAANNNRVLGFRPVPGDGHTIPPFFSPKQNSRHVQHIHPKAEQGKSRWNSSKSTAVGQPLRLSMGRSRRQVFGRQDSQVGEGGAQSAGVRWACFGGKDLAPNRLKM